jgi:uroporphyrinogen decarboxylase
MAIGCIMPETYNHLPSTTYQYMQPAWHDSPMMRAARCETADRTPIWLMRQAGRYMAEYRAIRRRIPFLQLCKNPDLCAEVMLTAVERLKVDAAIVFSDLLLILEPMGIQIDFPTGEGPVLSNPIRTPADVDGVRELENAAALEFVMEAVRKTRAGLPESLPLIGFSGAPFTLAAYAIEGGSSRDYRLTKTLMYSDIGAWNVLMSRLARAIGLYLNAQIAAGVQLVQLFDSWVGCLGVDDYCRYVMPHTQAVIESLPPDVPVIHFTTGNPALLPCIKSIKCPVDRKHSATDQPLVGTRRGFMATSKRKNLVIGVDWRMRLDEAWQTIGHDTAIQGNLDPAVLLSTPAEIRRRAGEIIDQAAGRPGHIFNLGHGVLPQTPVENVIALVDAVHELSRH